MPQFLPLLPLNSSTLSTESLSPLKSSDLLPRRIDHYAQLTPERLFAQAVISPESNGAYTDISYRTFANAINRAAHWLDSQLGPRNESSVMTFFGPSDLRVPVLLVAAIKTGRLLQLCSPTMLGPEGRRVILKAVGCTHVLVSDNIQAEEVWNSLEADSSGLKKVEVPRLEYLLGEEQATPYPYSKALEDALDDAAVGFHTSGTTGDPKPVIYTNRSLLCLDAACSLPQSHDNKGQPHSWQLCAGKKFFNNFSFFHIAGTHVGILLPVYNNMVGVHSNPYNNGSGSAAQVATMIRATKPHSALITPWTLEAMAQNTDQLAVLQSLDPLYYAGAPLKESVGNLFVSSSINLHTAYGSTEMYPLATYSTGSSKDWQYVRFHPSVGAHMEFHSPGTDPGVDLYELVIKREKNNLSRRDFQAVFTLKSPNLHGEDSWHTKDLWTAHPTLPDYWRFYSRSDDMIAFESGKLLVSGLENELAQQPGIKAVVVGAVGRPRPMLLIEIDQEALLGQQENGQNSHGDCNGDKAYTDKGGPRDVVWKFVEKLNESLNPRQQFERMLMVLAEPDRPFVRTGKGSVNRKATLQLYDKEIEEAYKAL